MQWFGAIAGTAVEIPTSFGNGADTYLSNDPNSGPSVVHGLESEMHLRFDPAPRLRLLYLRFDISGVQGSFEGASITLEGTSINRTRPIDFHGVVDGASGGQGESWTEGGAAGVSFSTAAGINPASASGDYMLTAEATPAIIAQVPNPPGSAVGPNTTAPSAALDAFLAADSDGLVTFIVTLETTRNGSESFFFSTKEGGVAPVLMLPNASIPPGLDADDDGLDDRWEDRHFGDGDGTATIGERAMQSGDDDPDGDGFANEQEETASTDPNDAAAYPGGARFIYVAPDGDDGNPGTIDQPFATVGRAQTAVSAGSTVYFRGGTYAVHESEIDQYTSVFARVFLMSKDGSEGNPIRYWAYPGEEPVLDLSQVNPPDYRVYTFYVTGDWLHFRGLTVTGVQVNITGHTQSICFDNEGSHNIYERLVMRDNQAIGMWIGNGSDNLVLNCDAYRNWDYTSEGGVGGNVDGFGCHASADEGNVFRGCRAWLNSDDGFDLISAKQPVLIDRCWAAYNGYDYNFVSRGDGNGFKAGGYGKPPSSPPGTIPRHVVRDCLAVGNKQSGFYANHHPGGLTFIGNTALRNRRNFNMLNWSDGAAADVDGYDHVLRNNLGLNATLAELSSVDLASCDSSHNYWELPVTVSATDFQTIDEGFLTAPRQASGELPVVPLMRLVAGSDLIDRGSPEGDPFAGAAPDLGCFEFDAIEVGNDRFSLPVVSGATPVPAGMVWAFEAGSGVRSDGADQVAFIGGSGSLQQTCDGFEPGELYHLRIEAAAPAGSAEVALLVDGDSVATRSAGGSSYGALDVPFIASSSRHTLKLAGVGSANEFRVRSLGINRVGEGADSDADSLGDAWEFRWFGDLRQDAAGDFDRDGSNQAVEQALALDPTSGSESFSSRILNIGGIQWRGSAGVDFSIQRSTGLEDWFELDRVEGVDGWNSFVDPAPPSGRAFYRVAFELSE